MSTTQMNSDKTQTMSSHSYEKHKKEMEFNLHRSSEANYRQFLFRNIIIYTQLLIIGVLVGFIFYSYQHEKIYVVKDGQPYEAMAKNDERSDGEIHAFIENWLRYLVEITPENYEHNRSELEALSSNQMVERIKYQDINSVTVKAVLNTGLVKPHIKDVVISEIKRNGSIINVALDAVRETSTPDENFEEKISQTAQIVTVKRSYKNPFGLKMISMAGAGLGDQSN